MIKGVVLNWENQHKEDVTRMGASWLCCGWQGPIYSGLETICNLDWGNEPKIPSGNSRYLMGWNEPDCGTITPLEAAIRWWEVIEPMYATRYILVASAVAHWDWGWHQEWHKQFRHKYGRWPTYDAVNIHGYSSPSRNVIPEFESALAWVKQMGKKLWITEYAAVPDPNWTEMQALTEAWRVIGWCLLNDVERFAWFNTRTTGKELWTTRTPLFEYDSGIMTAYGKLYASWQ